jgi:hypothetical protein
MKFIKRYAYLRLALSCLLFLTGSLLFCQQGDTIYIKNFDHFVGVQVNPLLRQIINFSESDPVNNPYLIKYTLRHNKSGLTFNVGGGLNTASTENEDGLKTDNDSYAIRGGFGYQQRFSKRFEAGVGVDFIYGNTSRETFSVQVFDFGQQTDSTISRVRNASTRIGGGIQLNLNYYISERILIGTECTLYYTKLNDRFNVEIDNYLVPNSNDTNFTRIRDINVINEKDTGKSFAFLLPVALYLSFKF